MLCTGLNLNWPCSSSSAADWLDRKYSKKGEREGGERGKEQCEAHCRLITIDGVMLIWFSMMEVVISQSHPRTCSFICTPIVLSRRRPKRKTNVVGCITVYYRRVKNNHNHNHNHTVFYPVLLYKYSACTLALTRTLAGNRRSDHRGKAACMEAVGRWDRLPFRSGLSVQSTVYSVLCTLYIS